MSYFHFPIVLVKSCLHSHYSDHMIFDFDVHRSSRPNISEEEFDETQSPVHLSLVHEQGSSLQSHLDPSLVPNPLRVCFLLEEFEIGPLNPGCHGILCKLDLSLEDPLIEFIISIPYSILQLDIGYPLSSHPSLFPQHRLPVLFFLCGYFYQRPLLQVELICLKFY